MLLESSRPEVLLSVVSTLIGIWQAAVFRGALELSLVGSKLTVRESGQEHLPIWLCQLIASTAISNPQTLYVRALNP